MIQKLALLATGVFIGKKLLETRVTEGAPEVSSVEGDGEGSRAAPGHTPADLGGETHPDGTARAEEHYRPDPTAPVDPEDREGFRPVTLPVRAGPE